MCLWLIQCYNKSLPMRKRVLTSVMAHIGMSIYDKYTDKVENRQCGALVVFSLSWWNCYGAGNHLKRGGERDINQVAFKFTANVCAVRRRARYTTGTLREFFFNYSMTSYVYIIFFFPLYTDVWYYCNAKSVHLGSGITWDNNEWYRKMPERELNCSYEIFY